MEAQLREAILKGKPLDARIGDVPAALLTRLLGGDDWEHRPRVLLLGGVRITGRFDLSDLEVACPVTLLDCRFEHSVVATVPACLR